jgi:hypothetical protein
MAAAISEPPSWPSRPARGYYPGDDHAQHQALPDQGPAQVVIGEMAGLLRDTRRTRLRGHAHPAPPRPDHRPHFQGFRRTSHTPHLANQSCPAGMARSRRMTAKHQ